MAKKKSQHKKKGSKAGQSITQHPSASSSSAEASADSSRPTSPTPEEPLKEEAASPDSVQAGETPLAVNDAALPETPMPSKTIPSQEEEKEQLAPRLEENSTSTPLASTTDLPSTDDKSAPASSSPERPKSHTKVSDLPSSHNQVRRDSPDHPEVPMPDFKPNDEVAEKREGRRKDVSSEHGDEPEEPTSHPTASAGTEVSLEKAEKKKESAGQETVEHKGEVAAPAVEESKPEPVAEPAVKEKTEAELERERMMEARIAGARHMIMLAQREKKKKAEREASDDERESRPQPFKEDSFTRGISDAFNRKKSSFTPIDNDESAITDEPESDDEGEDYQSLRTRNPGMFISNLPRRFTMEEGPKFAPSQAATPPKSILATPVGERMSFSQSPRPNLGFNEASLIHEEETVPESTSGKIKEILEEYAEVPGDEPIVSSSEGPEPTDEREYLPSGSRRSSILERFRPQTPVKGEPTESPSEADARVIANSLHASLQEDAPHTSLTKLSHGISHSYTGSSSHHPGRSTPSSHPSHPGHSSPGSAQPPAEARKLTLDQLPEIRPDMLVQESAAVPQTPDETGRPTPHHAAAAELKHELKEEAKREEERKAKEIKPEEISSEPNEKEKEEELDKLEDDQILPIDKDEPLPSSDDKKDEPSQKSFFDVDAPQATATNAPTTSTDAPTSSTDAPVPPTTKSDAEPDKDLPVNSVPLLPVEQPGASVPSDLDEHSVLSNLATPAEEKDEILAIDREESSESSRVEKKSAEGGEHDHVNAAFVDPGTGKMKDEEKKEQGASSSIPATPAEEMDFVLPIDKNEVGEVAKKEGKEEADAQKDFDRGDSTPYDAPGLSKFHPVSVVPDPPTTSESASAAIDEPAPFSSLADLPATPAEEKDELLPIDREDFTAVEASETNEPSSSEPASSSSNDASKPSQEKKTYSSLASLPTTPANEDKPLPIDRDDFDISSLLASSASNKKAIDSTNSEEASQPQEGELISTQRDQPEEETKEEKIPSINSLPATPAEEKDEILPIDREDSTVEDIIQQPPKADREAAIEAVREALRKEQPKEEPKEEPKQDDNAKVPSLDSLPATPVEEKEDILPIDRDEPIEETLGSNIKEGDGVDSAAEARREAAIEAVREALRKEQPKAEEQKIPSLDSLPATPAEEKEGMLPIDRDEPVEETLNVRQQRPVATPHISSLDISDLPPTPAEEKDEILPIDKEEPSDAPAAPGVVPSAVDEDHDPEEEQRAEVEESREPKEERRRTGSVDVRVDVETEVHRSPPDLDAESLGVTREEEQDQADEAKPLYGEDVDPSTIAKIDDTVAPSTPPITEPISIPWEHVPTPTDSLPTGKKEAKEMETSEAQSVETAGEIADDLGLEKSEMSAEAKEDFGADSTVQSSPSEPSSAEAVDAFSIAQADDTVAATTPPITEPISIPWEHVPTPTDSLPTEEKEAKEKETSDAQSVETASEIADDLDLEKKDLSEEATASAPAVDESATPEHSTSSAEVAPETELKEENDNGPSIDDAAQISADPYDSQAQTSEEVAKEDEKKAQEEEASTNEESSTDATAPVSFNESSQEPTESQMDTHAAELVGTGILGVAGTAAAGVAALSSSASSVVEQSRSEPSTRDVLGAKTVSELLSNHTSTTTETGSNQGEPPSTPAVERSGFATPVTAEEEAKVDDTPPVSAEEVFSREEVPKDLLTSVEAIEPSDPEPEPTPLPSRLRDASSIPSPSISSFAQQPGPEHSSLLRQASSSSPAEPPTFTGPSPAEKPSTNTNANIASSASPSAPPASSSSPSVPAPDSNLGEKVKSDRPSPQRDADRAERRDTPGMSTQEQQKRLLPPVATEWRLKDLTWPDPRTGGARRTVKIICQEANGPCSLISLVNVLTLRGSIHIDPSRSKVDYDYLSSLIADFLLDRQSSQTPTSPSLSLSSALSILPSTIRGLDLNPSFSSAGAFKEGDRDGGELALFELCGVRLTHGWVVDAGEGKESEVIERVGSYDAAQSLLVAADVGGKGLAEDVAIVKHFLDSTQTQLTMSGLFAISDSLEAGEAVALFRNSHLSVLYKRPADASSHEPLLFCLVTDEAFRKEPEIMWESLADVSGSTTSYFTSDFTPSSSAGGNEPGLSAEEVVRRDEFASGGGVGGDDDYNMQLARQLQEEEDALAAQTLAFTSSRQPDLATRATSSLRTRKQFLGTAAPLSPLLGATTSRQSPEIGSGSFIVVPEQEEGQGGKERLEASRQRLKGQVGEGSGGAGAAGSGEVKGKGKEKKEKEKKKGKGCVVM